MDGYTFRPHRPDEEPIVVALMRALDAEGAGIRPINEATLAKTFAYLRAGDDRGSCVLAIDPEGRVVGYALLFPFFGAEYGGLLLLIDELYVVPELRSRGVGGAFLDWIEAFARDRGYVSMSLVAMSHNRRAISFYERQGYYRIDAVSFDKLLRPRGEGE
jgi:GNAT superfamily N-acetyltransferase